MAANRGARGWQPPEREVVKEFFEATMERRTTIVMDGSPVTDLVEHNGVWMTRGDRARCQTTK